MESVTNWISKPVGAVSVFLLLALILTFPMCLHPIDTVVGHEQASVGCHVWVIWWARQSLELHTPLIFFPYGADVVQLYGSDLLSPLLFSVVSLPPSLLYNLWVLFLLTIGALGMRQLLLFLRTTPWMALAGGWAWMNQRRRPTPRRVASVSLSSCRLTRSVPLPGQGRSYPGFSKGFYSRAYVEPPTSHSPHDRV